MPDSESQATPPALPRFEPFPGEELVGLFVFFSWMLVALVAVTISWPLNIPLLALAYKIHHGNQKLPLESGSYWQRATFAALGLAGMSILLLALTYLLVAKARLPAGMVHIVLFMAYLPVGVWLVFWLLALEELIEGLSVFLLYVFLPGLPLLLLKVLFPSWQVLAWVARWLQVPS